MAKLYRFKKSPKLDWDSMSRRGRRVAIAQDVLDQLRLGAIQLMRGEFLTLDDARDKLVVQSKGRSLRSLVAQSEYCDVCARGAIFVSYLNLFNSDKTDATCYPTELAIRATSGDEHRLSDAFSCKDFQVIEGFYEGMGSRHPLVGEFRLLPVFQDREATLVLLMENIIKYGGLWPSRLLTAAQSWGKH